jgi:arylformamidase
VADSEHYLADWRRRSEALHARMPDHLDLAYGDAPRPKHDFFAAGRSGAPTLLFFHGGYWRATPRRASASSPKDRSPMASMSRSRAAPWPPRRRWNGIVREARSALPWLHQHLARLGGDPGLFQVGGWSAGGHIATMLMAEPVVAGGLAISGLFDLDPIRLCYLNDKLGLDADEARRNGPLLHLPPKLIVAYGTDERPERKRQSRA